MKLKEKDIIELCYENLQIFKEAIKGIPYEVKGIYNSEMLLFVSLAKYL